ncbi:MAG: Cation/acetate symporter [Hyphomicrobiales bacterium]|nr:Cation/acetate symporter [Hyphomicrobiales bacterium]
MTNQVTDDERRDRATLDGRITFTTAAFGLGAGLLVLLDRVGLPQNIAVLAGFVLAVATLCAVGLFVRSVKISTFYAAGRSIPATYGGLAAAACIAGVAMIFLPPLPDGLTLTAIALGLAAGVAILTLVSAPIIRKSGAFSMADLLALRFPALAFRLVAILVIAAICGLTALAGFEQAIRLLATELGMGRVAASVLIAAILILAVAPGGLAGLAWSAAAAGGILVATMLLPLLVLATRGSELPLPFFGGQDVWAHASQRVAEWTNVGAGVEGATWLAMPIALGMAGFAPLLSFAVASRNRSGAQRTQLAMLIWLLVIGAAVMVIMAATALSLEVALLGQRPDRLADTIYRASAEGWLNICGRIADGPAPARAACAALPDFAAVLRPTDFTVSPGYLLFGLADLRELGGAYRGLASAGWFVACLALAAAGLQGAATALGHDLAYRVRDRFAITSRRLATTRLLLLGCTVAAGATLAQTSPDPRLLTGLALTLSAAGIAPLLLLTLWPRAGSPEAFLAMAAGVGTACALLLTAGPTSALPVSALGQASLAGAAAALAVGILASLRPGAAAAPGTAFLDTLLHGHEDSLSAERGA